MKTRLILTLASCLLLTGVPAVAAEAKTKSAASYKMEAAHKDRLSTILADPSRVEDAKRDKYRHPAETFAFFRLQPDHVIGEYAPGGEWVSRILGRYVDERGKYTGLYFGTNTHFDDKQKAGIAAGVVKFPNDVAAVSGRSASSFNAFSLSSIPEGAKGTFDRILLMRMMHNMLNWDIADAEIKAMRDLLKDDGMIGIEQHRAKATAPYEYTDGTKGYLRQNDVIKFMEVNGFELVAKSEINANSKDSANWPDGVWTLPPVLRLKDQDREKYEAIGESDRMTLLFKKRL